MMKFPWWPLRVFSSIKSILYSFTKHKYFTTTINLLTPPYVHLNNQYFLEKILIAVFQITQYMIRITREPFVKLSHEQLFWIVKQLVHIYEFHQKLHVGNVTTLSFSFFYYITNISLRKEFDRLQINVHTPKLIACQVTFSRVYLTFILPSLQWWQWGVFLAGGGDLTYWN